MTGSTPADMVRGRQARERSPFPSPALFTLSTLPSFEKPPLRKYIVENLLCNTSVRPTFSGKELCKVHRYFSRVSPSHSFDSQLPEQARAAEPDEV